MTPLVRWLKKVAAKWADTYHEGERAPSRIAFEVAFFAKIYPRATRSQWAAMATSLAEQSYEAGYLRGVEWVERDPDQAPGPSPEEIMDEVDPNWRDSPPVVLDGSDVVLEEVSESEAIVAQMIEARHRSARRY